MSNRHAAATAVLVAAWGACWPASAFDEEKGGLLTCTTVSAKAKTEKARKLLDEDIGERFLLGLDVFGDVTVLYASGASPRWECRNTGTTYLCHFSAINRDAVFDAATRRLTMPSEFQDDYTVSTCEPFDLPRR